MENEMVLEGGEKGGQGNVVGDGERKGKEGINGWVERKDEGKAEREIHAHSSKRFLLLSARHIHLPHNPPVTAVALTSGHLVHGTFVYLVPHLYTLLPVRTTPSASPSGVYSSIFINLRFSEYGSPGWGVWSGLSERRRNRDRQCHRAANECRKTDILAPGHVPLQPIASNITTPLVMSPRLPPFTLPTSLKGSVGDIGLIQGHVFPGNLRNFPCRHAQYAQVSAQTSRGVPPWPPCLKEPPLSLCDCTF